LAFFKNIGDKMDVIKRYMSKLIKIINKDEMKILPGHLSFYFILSLIPAITLLGIICHMLGLSNDDVTSFFWNIMPNAATEIIKPFVKTSGSSLALVYLIISLIIVSNGAYALILTCNTLYQLNDISQLKARIKSVILTFLFMFIFVFILIVLAFGNMIVKWVLSLEVFSNITWLYKVFIYSKWPVAFVIIYIVLKLIYTIAPDKTIKSRSVTKGAIFTTVLWLIITAIYSYYCNNIARYDMFYGNLSNIIILMMWIYLITYIFVIGIAINVNNYSYMAKNTIIKEEDSTYNKNEHV